jgi:Zn finger protein HypA/HybF involved in hydrogenase expression
MVTEEQLKAAAFWGDYVCMDCGEQADTAASNSPCEACGSEDVQDPQAVLDILAKVERNGESLG